MSKEEKKTSIEEKKEEEMWRKIWRTEKSEINEWINIEGKNDEEWERIMQK